MQQHCNLILNDRGALWLGDYESTLNLEFLKSKGIRTIITVAAGLNEKYEGIVHHKIEILDIELTNISQYFQTAIDWIERGFNIGGVLAKFIVWQASPDLQPQQLPIQQRRKMTYYQAFTFVKSKRPQINPNKGFANQLMQFAARHSQPPIPKPLDPIISSRHKTSLKIISMHQFIEKVQLGLFNKILISINLLLSRCRKVKTKQMKFYEYIYKIREN